MRLICILLLSLFIAKTTAAQYHVRITPFDKNIYLYTSYGDVGNFKKIDANAVIVVSGKQAVLFDTPWDSVQAEQLISYVQDSLKKKISTCIITHAHADRIGSIDVMHQHHIPTYGYYLIKQEATNRNYTPPQHLFYSTDTTFKCGRINITALYPGAGHTIDNIVLYIPSKQFLYGGCFIKSGQADNMGNIEDADVTTWPHGLANMEKHFQPTGIKTVIPGHGDWHTGNPINNTRRLLTKEAQSNY